MRMFLCGFAVALVIAIVWAAFMPGDAKELGNQAAYAAFVCGAVSQGIKQFKE